MSILSTSRTLITKLMLPVALAAAGFGVSAVTAAGLLEKIQGRGKLQDRVSPLRR